MKRTGPIVALLLLALLAVMGVKGAFVPIPSPAGHSAAAGEFDTGRAMERLRRVLGDQRPHPVDSDSNDRVRDRLLAELRALGLAPRVADSFTCNGAATARTVSCARIRNVVATIGPAEGRHVLLVSHYDSTPTGPGASDDGIGMASMLEVAALLKDRPLRRPVSFLFNEGEETGLIGARAFLDRDPIAARVDSLVNLESRGTTGPAIMFETSRPNGRAIRHYARSAVGPAANSLTTDFSRLIPNQT
ncbi:MAG TPA: M20/M25/M40 family metallo-hydrolase, partial [Allosphingosinicella sp.]|nr:M20/M25/M40 family metallo-hydrolase [Allosphingosinicella sp.]